MVVRELITRLGFSLDEAKIKHYERKAETVAAGFGRLNGLVTAAMAVAAGMGLAQIKSIADEWTLVEGRVSLVTKSVEEQNQALSQLYDIANRTRQEYTASADLFARVGRNAEQLKMTQADVLETVEAVNKSMVISGAATSEAKAAIIQFGQALASDRFQGDELRSILENAPRLARAIADGLGVTIGKLREMGANGELTAKTVIAALLKQKGAIDKEFERMPLTIGQALTVAGNKFGRFINRIGKETGIFKRAAQGIIAAATWMENKIDSLAAKVGGLENLFKIAGIVVAAVAAGWLAIKWAAIAGGIDSITRALWLLARNPAALSIAALLLLLDDLYTWMQGGDSVIGDTLGSFEEVAKSLKPLTDALMEIGAVLKPVLQDFDTLGPIVKLLGLGVEASLQPLKALLMLLQAISRVIADIRGSGGGTGELADISMQLFDPDGNPVRPVTAGAMASTGRAANVTQTFEINQTFGPGTPTQQAAFVGDAAEGAYKDTFGPTNRAITYAFTD